MAHAPRPPFNPRLTIVDSSGEGIGRASDEHDLPPRGQIRFLLTETLRWGEPYWYLHDNDIAGFALPVTWNELILGGVYVDQIRFSDSSVAEIHSYAHSLAELFTSKGLLNAPLMRANQSAAAHERARAEAIHSIKHQNKFDFRSLYTEEEPRLLIAMQQGRRQDARQCLNRILVAIYNQATSDLPTVKRLIGELVLLMQRAMLECGLQPDSVLLSQYDPFARLREVDDEEALSVWTREVLEGLMDASAATEVDVRRTRIQLAIRYMRENLAEPLQRDEVARVVGISPQHFTHLIKLFSGRSFTDMLTHLRIERAANMLQRTRLTVQTIAAECGFSEQAYFTRVFRKHFGMPPSVWRRKSL